MPKSLGTAGLKVQDKCSSLTYTPRGKFVLSSGSGAPCDPSGPRSFPPAALSSQELSPAPWRLDLCHIWVGVSRKGKSFLGLDLVPGVYYWITNHSEINRAIKYQLFHYSH